MEINYIYGLKDPNTLEIRYIGKSKNPKDRFRKHLLPYYLKSDTYKNRWLRKLLTNNQKPLLEIIYQVKENEDVNYLERYYISEYRKTNKLTNTTDGGDGGATMTGKKMSRESIEKIIQKQKGIKWTKDDPRRKFLSISQKGKIPWQATNKATIVNSKDYEVTYPDGRVEIVNNLAQFSRDNNLSASHMHSVARGERQHHKKFKVKKINK